MKKWMLFSFVLLAGAVQAQQYQITPGKVEIFSNSALNRIIQAKRETFLLDSTSQGFRIQIFSNSDRRTVMQEEERFRSIYPEIPVYLKFDSPNFKLRAGDFKTRLEAQYWFYQLAPQYPNLFLVPDKINPPLP